MDFLPKRSILGQFWPFSVTFRYFPLLSVTSFPLEKGDNDRWSGQEYSREPLETFILSFTRLILALEPKKWIFSRKGRFLLIFGPKMVIFRYFPLLSVTSFPLEEGHNNRWSGQAYSREPLETLILSFTRLILALEPRKWIFSPKRSILGHFWPFSVTFRYFP